MDQTELHLSVKMHGEQRHDADPTNNPLDRQTLELGDGKVAVRNKSGNYVVYFDKEKFEVENVADDKSVDIPNFPENTGLIQNMLANNFRDIAFFAKGVLKHKQ